MSPELSSSSEALRAKIRDAAPEDRREVIAALGGLVVEASTQGGDKAAAGSAPDENLDVREAARRLGVSTHWLYKHARRLPFTVRVGRRRLFSARGLERWNKQRQGR